MRGDYFSESTRIDAPLHTIKYMLVLRLDDSLILAYSGGMLSYTHQILSLEVSGSTTATPDVALLFVLLWNCLMVALATWIVGHSLIWRNGLIRFMLPPFLRNVETQRIIPITRNILRGCMAIATLELLIALIVYAVVGNMIITAILLSSSLAMGLTALIQLLLLRRKNQ